MTVTSTDSSSIPAVLHQVLEELVRELRPGRRPDLSPRRSLDRDLGLDSLARVELLARLETACGVQLPQKVAVEAETVGDLIRALERAAPAGARLDLAQVAMPQLGLEIPLDAETLVDVLVWHAERHPERTQIWLYEEDESVRELTFGGLLRGAQRVAAGLRARGIEPQQTVALMFPTGEEFLLAFFGVLLVGAVPVPLYPPVRPSQLEEHLRRQAGILRQAEARLMLTVDEAKRLGLFLRSQVPTLTGFATIPEISGEAEGFQHADVKPDDLAFIQFTSGSTGNPKGVMLTHANLLANMRVICEFADPQPSDVFVSWLPLYHDMGLIGAVLSTFYYGIPLVLMSPLAFLTRPERWLKAIHRHRGTFSAAPNFAYALCTRKVPQEVLAQLDLSCWRMTLNGAEPISPSVYEEFAERFAACGYRAETMTPTYGLAECSLALTMTPPERLPQVDRVERAAFSSRGRATPASLGERDALEFVNCGTPMRGHELRVVDPDSGRELEERREGRLQFRGPSASSGYYRDPEASARLIGPGGWLDTGDLAYLAGGELFVTGRVKDVIIRAGRNIYPHELEAAVSALPLVRTGCVAVFAANDAEAGTEKLVVLAETREQDPAARAGLESEILALSRDLLGAPADDVVLAPPRTVLKTSSGKIRRAGCRELYEQGRLGGPGAAVWWQMARLTAIGWRFAARRRLERAGELAYTGHFWAQWTGHLIAVWMGVALSPSRPITWRVARGLARSFLRVTGLRTRIEGGERLAQAGPTILVANHSSYLDGIVAAAVIPGEWAPVVKSSLRDQRVMGLLLRKLGAVFVDRFDRAAGVEDARRIPSTLAEGRPVLVFPEGTCLRLPGLLPFQMGAFQAAATAGAAVLPLTIRGTRMALRPGQWWPRPGQIEVEVGEPILPQGEGWESALALRDAARAAILARCGEPDLGHEDARSYLPTPG